MTLRFGLTEDHIEALQNGESVEFVIGDLRTPGHNTTVIIEPADFENAGQYRNPGYIWDPEDE